MTSPIIAGFYPDPSICRVGDTYYTAHSSFEYAPAMPIFRSTDLTSWDFVANAMSHVGQLPEHAGDASTGIFAPTLRHHGGRFWLTTTNMNEIARGQLIMSADDAAGPWSEPVFVSGTVGIDPDLSWDEHGTCHLTWKSFTPELQGIATVAVDPATGARLGEVHRLWNGTGLAAPEGPHLYRVGQWWYLLLAEGGTERGHCVTVARARTLEGPFEPAPHNPILTHRSTAHPVQNVGHADLVDCGDGAWAAVYLGVRPRGQTPMFHVNGRETFLAGVDWVDGWPVIEDRRFIVAPADHSFDDDFADPTLDGRWVTPGRFPGRFARSGGGRVRLSADGGRGQLLTRVRDCTWTAEVTATPSDGVGRFLLRIDDAHWYALQFDQRHVHAIATVGPLTTTFAEHALSGAPVRLRIRAYEQAPRSAFDVGEPDTIELSVAEGDREVLVLACLGGRYLSTEVAGGFTGRMVGVEVVRGTVSFSGFRYRSDTPVAQ